MKRLLREPLVHFLLIGAALFAVYHFIQPRGGPAPAREIQLSLDELTQLAAVVSLPLAQRLADATSDRPKLFAEPVQELAWDSDSRADLTSLLTERSPGDERKGAQ